LKFNFDEYDNHILKKIENRKEMGSEYPHEKLFEEIYDVSLSQTEARKELRGIENHLNAKKELFYSKEDLNLDDESSKLKYKESIEIHSDGKQVSDKLIQMNEEQSKDIEYVLKAHGYDVNKWEIVSAKNNIWNVYSKQDGIQTLYSSKVTVKPKICLFDIDWIRDVIRGMDFSKNIKRHTYNIDESSKTVEINFPDVHIGKFVQELVSNGVYDADIAINRFRKSINRALERVSLYNVKKFIFIIGQDFMNFDNFQGTTTKGTTQDMNEFYESVYKKAYQCLLETIEKLRAISPVHIIYVKGNHDSLSTFSMCYSLSELYKFNNIEDVTVDYSTLQRKYIKIGNTTLGFGHGEKERNRITDCMQSDVPALWNNKYRYFHLSHLHSEKCKEIGGVIYRWLGSLSENCKWTYESGYVGAQKKGHVFVYDDEEGLYGEFYINI
jgi:hypothetical protein